MKATYEELWAAVRAVAAGCRGCPRGGGSCAMCDRFVCRGIVVRMEQAERIEAAEKKAETARGDPCPECESNDGGACRKYGGKRSYCVLYNSFHRNMRRAAERAAARGARLPVAELAEVAPEAGGPDGGEA